MFLATDLPAAAGSRGRDLRGSAKKSGEIGEGEKGPEAFDMCL